MPISEDDLQAAPDCAKAHALHLFCGYGATGDRSLTTIVVEKCETVFLKKLTRGQKRTYIAKASACGEKARRSYNSGEGGTMALSEGAFCEEGVAASFARDAINAANPPAVKASFDCAKAETLLELAICSSDKTGAADIDLSGAYRAASRAAAPDVRQVLKESELGWLDYVVNICLEIAPMNEKQRSCVIKAFADRRALLPQCMAKASDERAKCLNAYKDDAAK
jgi:uncharacterized protein